MRKVVGPHQTLNIHVIAQLERGPIVLECHVDVFAKVLTRQLRHLVAFEPIAMPLISMVHTIHEVRCPTRVGFDADELQIRMPLEHTAENERTYDILVASNDRLERIDLWPAIVSQVVLLRR